MPVLEFLATLGTLLFTGAAIYINVAEHPARMECGTAIAATVFGPSYKRAAVMQAVLALFGSFAAIAAWLTGAPDVWLVGGLLIFAVVPFTFAGIMPTNKKLLDPTLDRNAEATRVLLVRWGRLHAVRSALGFLASVLMLGSLVWS